MSNDQHRLSVEVDADVSGAISSFNSSAEAAERFTNTLGTLDTALKRLGTQSRQGNLGISNNDQQRVERTLRAYQQLNSAVGGYARAVRQLGSPEAARGANQYARALEQMSQAIRNMSQLSPKQIANSRETLKLYRELAQVQATYSRGLKEEAAAQREIAQANKLRAQGAATTVGAGASQQRADAATQRASIAAEAEARQREQFEFRKQQAIENTTRAQQRQAEETERGLASTRYALYQVAAAYGSASAATLGFSAAAVNAYRDQERQFANVERVFLGQKSVMANMRDELVDLATQIPVTFEELSQIASLGGQVGVAEDNVDQFAEVVSKFVATSEAVQPDQAAMAFGRLSNMLHLTSDEYESLASMVSELGTSSAATEGEILTITEQIATAGNQAGMSTDEIGGMAAALASLRVRPEMARGAVMRIFNQINAAVAEGGPLLNTWAQNAGLAAEEASRMWREDPSQFFQRTVEGLSQIEDNVERQLFVLDELNIRNNRDQAMLTRLANGYETYAASMELAADSYSRGDFLDEAYAPIADTLAARLERLGNAVQGMMASFGEGSTVLKPMIEILIDIVTAIRDLPAPVRDSILTLTTLVGVFTAYKAALALSMAAMIGFRQVQSSSLTTAGVSARGFGQIWMQTFGRDIPAANARAAASTSATSASMRAATGSMTAATAAAGGLRAALGALGIPGLVMAVATIGTAIYSIATSSRAAKEEAAAAQQEIVQLAGGTEAVYAALMQDQKELESGIQSLSDVQGHVTVQTRAQSEEAVYASEATGIYADAHADLAERVGGTTTALEEQTLAIGKNTQELLDKAAIEKILSEDWFDSESMANALAEGFDFGKFLEISREEGAAAGDAFIENFITELKEQQQGLREVVGDDGMGGAVIEIVDEEQYRLIQDTIEVLRHLKDVGHDTSLQFDELTASAMLFEAAGYDTNDMMGEASSSMQGLEEDAEGLGEGIEEVTNLFSDFVDEMFALVNSEAAVEEALYSLGESIYNNGLDFATVTEAGRANLSSLESAISAYAKHIQNEVDAGNLTASEAAYQFAGYIEQLLNDLEAMGVDPTQFEEFRAYLDHLYVDNPLTPDVDINPALGAFNELIGAAAHTAQEVGGFLAAAGVGAPALGPGPWHPSVLSGQSSATRGGGFWNNSTARLGLGSGGSSRPNLRRNTGWDSFRGGRGSLSAGHGAAARADRENRRAQQGQRNLERAHRDTGRAAQDSGRNAQRAGRDTARAAEDARPYVERLRDAFQESFERRYGRQQAQDAVQLQLINMRERAEKAKQEVIDLREQARGLHEDARRYQQEAAGHRVDVRQNELFANVASMYGDTERYVQHRQQANEARQAAREADNNAKAAQREARQLEANSRELDRNRNALTGNSRAAIENRAEVIRLQQAMEDQILAYAASGATQAQVRQMASRLEQQFRTQLVQMGYNNTEVRRLSGRFVDLRRDINRIPRHVRVRAEATNVARTERQLSHVARPRTSNARANPTNIRPAERQLNRVARGRSVPIRFTAANQNLDVRGNLRVREVQAGRMSVSGFSAGAGAGRGGGGGGGGGRASGGVIPGRPPQARHLDNLMATINGGADGLIGVQAGEGVVNYRAMSHYGGAEWLDAVNNLQLPRFVAPIPGGGSSGGGGSNAVQVVELMPHQIKQLANAVSTHISLDGRTVAQAANSNNTRQARRGAN